MERISILKQKYPNIFYNSVVDRFLGNRLTVKTELVNTSTQNVGTKLKDWISFFEKLKDKWVQFEDVQVYFEGGNDFSNLAITGYMKETDNKYAERMLEQTEKLELVNLLLAQRKEMREQESLQIYRTLHKKYEGKLPENI